MNLPNRPVPLLDRLTDKQPKRTEEVFALTLSESEYRAKVLEHLQQLFNSVVYEQGSHPLLAASVQRYGLPALSGQTLNDLDLSRVQQQLADAVRHFEPRIDPQSLDIEPILPRVDDKRPQGSSSTDAPAPGHLQFRISATLFNKPYPVELFCHAVLNLDTGKFMVDH